MKKDRVKTARNRLQKEKMKDAIAAVEVAAKEKKDSKELVITAQKLIDKAVKKNLLHARTAARHKSKLVKTAKAA